ncbi:MAG TPA: DUF302 domain-containing protein [Thiothrix sp.]|nr:DUF302 domain-containing protein [Thiothrix sp.]
MRIRIDRLLITTFVVLVNLFIPNAFSAIPIEKNAEPFTLSVDSPYNFDETVKRVQEAVISNDFRVFPDRYLEQGLTDDFSVNERQLVIRFCHFGKLYKALKIEPRLGVVLPCKITVLEEEDGQVQIIYINAEALANVFDNKHLATEAQGIAENYSDILDEVLL